MSTVWPGIDNVTPGSVGYGFENFTTTRTPGYIWNGTTNVGTGSGTYAAIDRYDAAFRRAALHHGAGVSASRLGDRRRWRTIGVHRLQADDLRRSIAASFGDREFRSYASDPNNPNNRDLIVRSVDEHGQQHALLSRSAGESDQQRRFSRWSAAATRRVLRPRPVRQRLRQRELRQSRGHGRHVRADGQLQHSALPGTVHGYEFAWRRIRRYELQQHATWSATSAPIRARSKMCSTARTASTARHSM